MAFIWRIIKTQDYILCFFIHKKEAFEYIIMRRDIMSEVREIVTRAVLAKGRKIFRIHDIVSPNKNRQVTPELILEVVAEPNSDVALGP